MSQNMVVVCAKCKKRLNVGNFTFQKIHKPALFEFITMHKYHPIYFCGDDGGGELVIERLMGGNKKT